MLRERLLRRLLRRRISWVLRNAFLSSNVIFLEGAEVESGLQVLMWFVVKLVVVVVEGVSLSL